LAADAGVDLHGLAGGDGVEVLAPFVAGGRIDERAVEAFVRQRVGEKGVDEHDLKMAGGDFALRLQNEHVGAGDGPSLGIEFLPVEEDLGLVGNLLDAIFGKGQPAVGATAAVINGAGHALATGQVGN